MVDEWLNKLWSSFKTKSFKKTTRYDIAKDVVNFTERILQQYGARRPASEGLVYWAGTIDKGIYNITAAIAPKITASRYGISTTYEANACFVDFISDYDLVYIAQVHSHPSSWVDHSEVDNTETAFRAEGLVSIVVPNFSKNGMIPIHKCGIHLYTSGGFIRLSSKGVKAHFKIYDKGINKILLKDMRYD